MQIEVTNNEILLLYRLLARTREQVEDVKRKYGGDYKSQADVDVKLLESLLVKIAKADDI